MTPIAIYIAAGMVTLSTLADLLSFEDVFVVGIGFDIAGAYLLAKGLLVPLYEILKLSSSYWGFNLSQIVARVEDRVSGVIGVTALVIGFVCQLTGYLINLALASTTPGSPARAAAALSLAVVTIGATMVVHRALLPPLRRRALIDIAHYDNNGQRKEYPYGARLLALGTHMSGPMENESQPDYSRRVWRVTKIIEGGPGPTT